MLSKSRHYFYLVIHKSIRKVNISEKQISDPYLNKSIEDTKVFFERKTFTHRIPARAPVIVKSAVTFVPKMRPYADRFKVEALVIFGWALRRILVRRIVIG